METKILFTSDLHASETFFLKTLTTAKNLKVDVLLVSGDLTGKAIVPIVQVGDRYFSNFFGRDYKLTENEVEKFKQDVRKVGYYYYQCSNERYKELKAKPELVDKLFDEVMKNELEEWIKKINDVLPQGMKVIMNPGNDDHFSVDDVLRNADRIVCTEGKVEDLDGTHQLISCEWANPTPWDSPRECSEAELEKKLRTEFKKVSSTENLLCDIHVPPYNTSLDLAPKLDKNMQPKRFLGQPETEHVGSKSVRKVLEEYQPKLGLHGHIHESAGIYKLGRTLCVNPGSEYIEGIMHGYFLKITENSIDYQPIMGG
jgi:Icc-related predicted phosphoesterase